MDGNELASPVWGVRGYGNSVPVMMPTGEWGWAEARGGLAKRELFAAMAMQGMLANEGDGEGQSWSAPTCATRSIEFADALILALSRKGADHA